MVVYTIKADLIPEDDATSDRTIRITFDEDGTSGIEFVEDIASGAFVVRPIGSAANLGFDFNPKGSGATRSDGEIVETRDRRNAADGYAGLDGTGKVAAAQLPIGTDVEAAGAAAAVAASLATHETDTTTHGITAAAATVLDDATVAAMVDTLGGASSTGTGGLVRATSPTLVTPALGTPSSGTLTNCTGLPNAGVVGLGTAAVEAASATPSAGTIPIAAADKRLAAGWMRFWFMQGRQLSWSHDLGATTISTSGTPTTLSQVGTATPSSQDTSTTPREQHLTGAVSGNAGGRRTSATVAMRSWGGGMAARYLMGPNISNVRHWVGFSSAALDQVGTPTTEHVAGFRYDTGVDGTAFWRCVTCDGASNVTTTATSVAAANDTTRPQGWIMRIEWDASNVYFFIDDVLVATHTTNLPGSTTMCTAELSVTTLTSAAKRNAWAWMNVWY